ncbi:MAG: ABC transporter ATP-binding protein [Actinomycetota bacterium]
MSRLDTESPGPSPLRTGWRALSTLSRELAATDRKLLVGAVAADVVARVLALVGAGAGAYLLALALAGEDRDRLDTWAVIAVGVTVPVAVAAGLHNYWAHVASYRLLADLRIRLYDQLRRLSPAFSAQRRSGDTTSTAMADVELLEVFTSHLLPPAVVAVIVPGAALVTLGVFHPLLAVALLPFLLLLASVPAWLAGRALDDGAQIRTGAADLSADVVDAAQGVREVSTFGAGSWLLDRLETRQDALARATASHGRRAGLEQAATDVLLSLGTVATLLVSAGLVDAGRLDAELLLPAVVLAMGAFGPVIAVSRLAQELGRITAAAVRVRALLDERTPVLDTDEPVPPPEEVTIRFEDVTFAYPADHALPAVLDEASFSVPVGSTVALVGASGAGKTTCTHLLLRYWDPQAGRITIGDVDIRDLDQDELRGMIAHVPQDAHLFGWTVRDNVALAEPDAPDTAVRTAVETAQADEFVDAMPDGELTRLGERGSGVSGGQRQRLAIARALLADRPILVLDEAVSNLDAESERAFEEALARVAGRRTTLVIAHRPSTIRRADLAVVLADGRAVEIGPPDELERGDGELARLLSTGAT